MLKNLNSGVSDFFPSNHKDLVLISTLLKYLGIEQGFEIEFFSDFPQGSSLGVSSSLLVAVFIGLKHFFKFKYSRKEAIEVLKNIEARFMGYPAGIQDYLAPFYGGMNAFFFGINGFSRKKIKINKSLSDSFIFVFTGKSHFSGSPNWELFKRFFDKDKKILEGFNNIYKNSKKVLQSIENKDIKLLGKYLKEDFETRKNMLNSLIPEIDLFELLDSLDGVYGYRLCGAASGGTVVACIDKNYRKYIEQTVKERGYPVFDCFLKKCKVRVINV
ncbi:GHMP family kinase ATP-binding protein [Thermotomaculum hydrothermale]|uniref:GHMP family kinase ATP-binding protein n=1 Tax=Thermotomaculum hydrothermale TaxID=981385 RepID=UPI001916ADB2|nr:hypothetical protein [Thermotomaculum hydrothermale]